MSRIADLCAEDKAKIGNVLRALQTLQLEKTHDTERKNAEQQKLALRLKKCREQQAAMVKQNIVVKAKFARTLAALRAYAHKVDVYEQMLERSRLPASSGNLKQIKVERPPPATLTLEEEEELAEHGRKRQRSAADAANLRFVARMAESSADDRQLDADENEIPHDVIESLRSGLPIDFEFRVHKSVDDGGERSRSPSPRALRPDATIEPTFGRPDFMPERVRRHDFAQEAPPPPRSSPDPLIAYASMAPATAEPPTDATGAPGARGFFSRSIRAAGLQGVHAAQAAQTRHRSGPATRHMPESRPKPRYDGAGHGTAKLDAVVDDDVLETITTLQSLDADETLP